MANKSTTVAEDAIITLFVANLPTSVKGYVLPNVPMLDRSTSTPIADSASLPWVRLTINWLDSINSGNGGGTWIRRNGLISVDVFTKKGSGTNTSQAIREHFINLFENTEFESVKTFEAATAKIEDDPWLGYQININFYCEGL